MGRKPPFFDIESFLKDIGIRIENEPFMKDFHTYLKYTCMNKIKLTPKNRYIPMKHLYAINSLFQNPQKLDNRVGDKVFKTREEPGASRIYFIDLLGEASECMVSNDKDVLVPGPIYSRFMNSDGITKKRWLVISWYYGMDWDIWLPYGDFGKTLQYKALELLPYIKGWRDKRSMIHFKKDARKIIKELGLKWNALSQNFAMDNMIWGIEKCILEPFNFFDLIDFRYGKADKYGFKERIGFYVRPMAGIFLDELITTGEDIKKKQPAQPPSQIF